MRSKTKLNNSFINQIKLISFLLFSIFICTFIVSIIYSELDFVPYFIFAVFFYLIFNLMALLENFRLLRHNFYFIFLVVLVFVLTPGYLDMLLINNIIYFLGLGDGTPIDGGLQLLLLFMFRFLYIFIIIILLGLLFNHLSKSEK
jgi:hypothetical protein